MISQKNKAVIEDDVCYDIDPVLYGKTFRFRPTEAGGWHWRSFQDFAGWLYGAGKITHYSDRGDGLIAVGGYEYTYQRFLREMTHTGEMDALIIQYEQCQDGLARWISEIRPAQAGGEHLSPDGMTADQEETMWAMFYGLDDPNYPTR